MTWKTWERKSTGKRRCRREKIIKKGRGLIKKSEMVQSVFMRSRIKTRSGLF